VKTLIAIVNCHTRIAYQKCLRETWIPLVKGADVRFFLGPSDRQPEADEVFLCCDDSYQGLPSKVRAIAQWALENGYDWVLKCDDDVVMIPDKVLSSGFQYHDFSGHRNDVRTFPVPYGFCYWLSRRAMQLVVDAPLPPDNNDEVWVTSTLSKVGIVLHHDHRYVMHAGRQEDFVTAKPRPLRAPPRARRGPDDFADGTTVFAKCMFINWRGFHGIPDELNIAEMKKVFEVMRVTNK
jgi:hypothetical protein